MRKRPWMITLLGLLGLTLAMGGFLAKGEPVHYPTEVVRSSLDSLVENACEIRKIRLEETYDGPAIATLLAPKADSSRRGAVLYIHGYGDYFFQHHMLQWFSEQGFAFYALELRRYGRSWLPHQAPNNARDFREYFEEIDRALDIISRQGQDNLILMGHSTGGLVASLYSFEGPNRGMLDGMILNSPFLDFNAGSMESFAINALGNLSGIMPSGSILGGDSSIYTRSLHVDFGGRWDFNTNWKPLVSFPVYLSWLSAVGEAQRSLLKSDPLDIPLLLLHSDRSGKGDGTAASIKDLDAVLDVEDMRRIGPGLGTRVAMREVPGAMHDVFLSEPDALQAALRATEAWLNENFPAKVQ